MLIIARKTGRLGNRLRLFSHLIAWSIEYGIPISNPSFYKYAGLFQGTCGGDPWIRFPVAASKGHAIAGSRPRDSFASRLINIERSLAYQSVNLSVRLQKSLVSENWPMQTHRLELSERFDVTREDFIARARRSRVFLDGYRYRCPDLVRKHRSSILKHFRLVPALAERVDDVLRATDRQPNSRLVGVHIRHGDYRTYRDGAFYYSTEAYAEMMRNVESLYPGETVQFLICSDAHLHADDFPGLNVSISDAEPVVDMYALARCDQLMGPPSSFTQWSSFYGGNRLYHIHDCQDTITDDQFRDDLALAPTDYGQAA